MTSSAASALRTNVEGLAEIGALMALNTFYGRRTVTKRALSEDSRNAPDKRRKHRNGDVTQ